MNSQNVAYGLGQLGSVFLNSDNCRFLPPDGMVVVSIVVIEKCKFTHMIPDNQSNAKHVGTTVVTNSTGDGGTMYADGQAVGGTLNANLDNIAGVEIPAGVTINGRWSQVMIEDDDTGSAILYFGY
tara:strand:- start:2645 stop:3022 length:378 start_codon:yes stop_codon:yes gene_type:complete